jgi:hypothetical protein
LKHKEWARRIDVSPDGRWLASADERGGITIWYANSWAAHRHLRRPADFVAFDGDSKLLAATLCYSDKSKAACVLDVLTGKVVHELCIPGWKIKRSVLSADGKRIACSMEHSFDITQQKAVLLDLKTESVLSELAADFEDINDFCFLSDSKTIAVAVFGHHRKPVILWSIGASSNR